MRNSRSCAAEQFDSDASLEAEDQRAPNNLKNWRWMTVVNVRARQSTPAPHGCELRHSFHQAVGNTLVYSCKCIVAVLLSCSFVNSTSAAPWTACKGVFIQEPPHGKPLSAAPSMVNRSAASSVKVLVNISIFYSINLR